ncbi:hypothetical protein OIV83_006271 [Microbotryomycetes sp. JL201]|nr:hypothetical protein OIV83_006271 [Microbotryomycetes sp. JL201]
MDPFKSYKRSRSHPPKPRTFHSSHIDSHARDTPPVPRRQPSLSHDDLPATDPTSPRAFKLKALDDIARRLNQLVSHFHFPHEVTFRSSATDKAPKLDFTAMNAPVHAYEEALTKLLLELDGVQSEGDSAVRETRKNLVHRVETELERLEGMKREAFINGGRRDSQLPPEHVPQEGPRLHQVRQPPRDFVTHSSTQPQNFQPQPPRRDLPSKRSAPPEGHPAAAAAPSAPSRRGHDAETLPFGMPQMGRPQNPFYRRW